MIKIGDIVRHYSCGSKLELGLIIDIYNNDQICVYYPRKDVEIWTFVDEINVISTWENLEQKVMGDLVFVDDIIKNNILKNASIHDNM